MRRSEPPMATPSARHTRTGSAGFRRAGGPPPCDYDDHRLGKPNTHENEKVDKTPHSEHRDVDREQVPPVHDDIGKRVDQGGDDHLPGGDGVVLLQCHQHRVRRLRGDERDEKRGAAFWMEVSEGGDRTNEPGDAVGGMECRDQLGEKHARHHQRDDRRQKSDAQVQGLGQDRGHGSPDVSSPGAVMHLCITNAGTDRRSGGEADMVVRSGDSDPIYQSTGPW